MVKRSLTLKQRSRRDSRKVKTLANRAANVQDRGEKHGFREGRWKNMARNARKRASDAAENAEELHASIRHRKKILKRERSILHSLEAKRANIRATVRGQSGAIIDHASRAKGLRKTARKLAIRVMAISAAAQARIEDGKHLEAVGDEMHKKATKLRRKGNAQLEEALDNGGKRTVIEAAKSMLKRAKKMDKQGRKMETEGADLRSKGRVGGVKGRLLHAKAKIQAIKARVEGVASASKDIDLTDSTDKLSKVSTAIVEQGKIVQGASHSIRRLIRVQKQVLGIRKKQLKKASVYDAHATKEDFRKMQLLTRAKSYRDKSDRLKARSMRDMIKSRRFARHAKARESELGGGMD
jgi:hypothetical protein